MRLPVALLVLAFALSACISTVTEQTTTSTVVTTTAGETSTTADAETTSTSGQPAFAGPLPGTEGLSEKLQQQIAELVELTQSYRGLGFLRPPTITIVTPDELAERVRFQIEEDLEDVPADEAVLELLGLIPDDLDLAALYIDIYMEQVAGYYDLDAEEMVVPATGDELSAAQKLTLVHELTHALVDQRFDLGDQFDQLYEADRFDEYMAALSVSEGDATLTSLLYLDDLPIEEQQRVLAELFAADRRVLQQAPRYIQNGILFPYDAGLVFMQRLYDIGGFDEVNRAYLSLPLSTEQIITPRDYGRDLPIPVDVVLPDPEGYEKMFESVWGELSLALMFDQVLGERTSEEAADGWGGDEYVQWFDGVEAALVIDFRSDSDVDALELEEALVAYVETAMDVGPATSDGVGTSFVDGDYAFVARTGDRVVFVAAGDPVVGVELRSFFAEF